MRNNRMPDNYPLRTVVVSGNLMAAALEHADLYESMEIQSLIRTWIGAVSRADENTLPPYLVSSGNGLANGLIDRSLYAPHILDQFMESWRSSIECLRQTDIAKLQEVA